MKYKRNGSCCRHLHLEVPVEGRLCGALSLLPARTSACVSSCKQWLPKVQKRYAAGLSPPVPVCLQFRRSCTQKESTTSFAQRVLCYYISCPSPGQRSSLRLCGIRMHVDKASVAVNSHPGVLHKGTACLFLGWNILDPAFYNDVHCILHCCWFLLCTSHKLITHC